MRKLPVLLVAAALSTVAACGSEAEPAAPPPVACDALPASDIKAIAGGFTKKGHKIESGSVRDLPEYLRKFNMARVVAVSVEGEPDPAVLAMGADGGPIWAVDEDAKRLFEWGAAIQRDSPAWKAQLSIEMSGEAVGVERCES